MIERKITQETNFFFMSQFMYIYIFLTTHTINSLSQIETTTDAQAHTDQTHAHKRLKVIS